MNLDEGLVRLFDNKSSMEMAEIGVQRGIVDLFAVEATEVLVSQLTQENTLTRDREDGDRDAVGALGADGGDYGDGDRDVVGSVGAEFGDDEFGDEDRAMGSSVGAGKTTNKRKSTGKGKGKGKVGAADKGKGKVGAACKGKSKVDAADVVEDEAAEIPSFVDSDYDLSDHDEDEIMAAQVEGWKRVVDVMAKHPTDHLGDTSDSDELPSDSPSSGSEDEAEQDEDESKHVCRRYKAGTDLNDPRWEVGLRFNCKEDFTELIRHQGVLLGKKLRLRKNDKIRCVAYCRGILRSKKTTACPWFVQIAHRAAHGFWQISRLRNKHKCGGASYNHGCANSRYLSKKYKEDIRVFPGMTVGQFIEKVHLEMKITISPGKAKRAMQHARKMIEVDLVRQYKRLHDYKAEILRSNPGSTVAL